jgi:hypothetical protein
MEHRQDQSLVRLLDDDAALLDEAVRRQRKLP